MLVWPQGQQTRYLLHLRTDLEMIRRLDVPSEEEIKSDKSGEKLPWKREMSPWATESDLQLGLDVARSGLEMDLAV